MSERTLPAASTSSTSASSGNVSVNFRSRSFTRAGTGTGTSHARELRPPRPLAPAPWRQFARPRNTSGSCLLRAPNSSGYSYNYSYSPSYSALGAGTGGKRSGCSYNPYRTPPRRSPSRSFPPRPLLEHRHHLLLHYRPEHSLHASQSQREQQRQQLSITAIPIAPPQLPLFQLHPSALWTPPPQQLQPYFYYPYVAYNCLLPYSLPLAFVGASDSSQQRSRSLNRQERPPCRLKSGDVIRLSNACSIVCVPRSRLRAHVRSVTGIDLSYAPPQLLEHISYARRPRHWSSTPAATAASHHSRSAHFRRAGVGGNVNCYSRTRSVTPRARRQSPRVQSYRPGLLPHPTSVASASASAAPISSATSIQSCPLPLLPNPLFSSQAASVKATSTSAGAVGLGLLPHPRHPTNALLPHPCNYKRGGHLYSHFNPYATSLPQLRSSQQQSQQQSQSQRQPGSSTLLSQSHSSREATRESEREPIYFHSHSLWHSHSRSLSQSQQEDPPVPLAEQKQHNTSGEEALQKDPPSVASGAHEPESSPMSASTAAAIESEESVCAHVEAAKVSCDQPLVPAESADSCSARAENGSLATPDARTSAANEANEPNEDKPQEEVRIALVHAEGPSDLVNTSEAQSAEQKLLQEQTQTTDTSATVDAFRLTPCDNQVWIVNVCVCQFTKSPFVKQNISRWKSYTQRD